MEYCIKRCSECGQKVPIVFCPLLKTDCMKRKNLPCGTYPSPQCSNDKDAYNWSKASEKQCKTCSNCCRTEGGIKGITMLACRITGKQVLPGQACYKPEKWWKEKLNE